MMDSPRPAFRILWIGSTDPSPLLDALPTEGLAVEIEMERVIDFQTAIGRLVQERWDGVVLDQNAQPESALEWFCSPAGSACGAEVIAWVPSTWSLRIACDWINQIERLRLLPPSASTRALADLIGSLTQWRTHRGRSPREAQPRPTASPPSSEELRRLTQQATTDALTGLLRREEIQQRGGIEWGRAQRLNQPLGCVMADIDHFKRVNDVFGHHIGDQTLRSVARLLGHGKRPYDLVGRVGGEEFLLLLPGATLTQTKAIAERIRLGVEQHPWEKESLPKVTISLGVAELLAGQFPDLETMVQAADKALYEAKRRGRNQVFSADSEHPPVATLLTGDNATADSRPRLLVIDDTQLYLDELSALLGGRYRLDATSDPQQGLDWAEHRSYELALCDLHMPGVMGYEILERLKYIQPRCVRMIMSARGELDSAIESINQAEVYRYILKPWNDEELLLLIHRALEHHSLSDQLHSAGRETIQALALTIEMNDRSTRDHFQRVAQLSKSMGQALGYAEERLERLEFAAWLHDIGKVGIPDEILRKPTLPTPAEQKVLREHPQLGANLVASVEHLAPLAPIIRHHHEQFDGGGYPEGLKGRAIPEESRIIAIANAFDGQLNPRCSNTPHPPQVALEHLLRGRGNLFDPDLVDLFQRVYFQAMPPEVDGPASIGHPPSPSLTWP